jgi:hypothetical protein
MRAFSAALAASLLAPLWTVHSQEPPPLEPGARVKVTAPERAIDKQAGTVEALRGDTLVLGISWADDREMLLAVPFASVTRLDVQRGQKSNLLLGMGIGLFSGAGIGAAVLGYAGRDYCLGEETGWEQCAWLGAGLGGAAGLIMGTIAGFVIRTDRWEEVALDQLRVSLVPKRDGRFALGLSVAF